MKKKNTEIKKWRRGFVALCMAVMVFFSSSGLHAQAVSWDTSVFIDINESTTEDDADSYEDKKIEKDTAITFRHSTAGQVKFLYDLSRLNRAIEEKIDPAWEAGDEIFSYTPNLEDANLAGYNDQEFLGWKISEVSAGTTAGTPGRLYLVALQPIFKEYAITYELDGGTNAAGNPVGYTYGTGAASLSEATKEGYTFVGWYTDAALSTEAHWKAEDTTPVIGGTESGAKTFYAKYTAIPTPVEENTEAQGEQEADDTAAAKKVTDAINALPASDKIATTDKAAKELEAAKKEAQAAMNEQVTVKQKGKKFTVKWKKSTSADGYYVYANYCGKKATKPAKTVKKNTTTKVTISKINGKKISTKKNFYVYVVPYKIIDGKKVKLAKSTVAHLVGSKSKKYSNVKKLTLKKKKYTVKVGKKKKIKAKVTLVNKNKKHIPKGHGAKFRYKSSDTSIATVSKKGKIKGIKKGKCTIYVYSINGLTKKAQITVK